MLLLRPTPHSRPAELMYPDAGPAKGEACAAARPKGVGEHATGSHTASEKHVEQVFGGYLGFEATAAPEWGSVPKR